MTTKGAPRVSTGPPAGSAAVSATDRRRTGQSGWIQRAARWAEGIVARWQWVGSFHVQTLLIVALSVAAVAGMLIFLQGESIRRQVLDERAAGVSRMAVSLQQNAEHAAISGGSAYQIADLQRRLPDIARQLDAVEVAVANREGLIVASSFPARIGGRVESTTVEEVLGGVDEVTRVLPDDTFLLAQPFHLAGGELGLLQTRLDLVALLGAINDATGASIVPSVLVLVIALPLTAIASNRILSRTYARDQKLLLEARFGALVRHSSDLVMILGAHGRIQFVSPSIEPLLGYPPATLADSALIDLLHPDDADGALGVLAAVGRTRGVPSRAEWRLRRADGSWRYFETVATNLSHEGLVGGIVLNGRDVSERRGLEDQLAHQAFHDPLTDLPNRALFEDRVEQALARWRRHGRNVTVVLLDLDDFKKVNDSLGHFAGDQLLVGVSHRLQASIRTTDTAARLGGDEFALLLEEADPATVPDIVGRVEASFQAPFEVESEPIHVTASLGIASTAAGLAGAAELLRGADVAMYSAKARAKGSTAIFQPSLQEAVVHRVRLEAELRRAIERQEFVVHYQPIVKLRTQEIVGVEALLRWADPERGLVAPPTFVPLAEETGLIVPIGEWVLTDACRQAQAWREAMPKQPEVWVSVNLSARQVHDPTFDDMVARVLRDSGLPPAQLVLEITEGVVLRDADVALDRLGSLRQLGVRLAIDDFGTGYASLAYLSTFPVDILKIDQSFVDRIGRSRDARALAKAIVDLGRSLRLTTVAEGVETMEQADLLTRFGCDLAQGFLFSPPVSPAVLTARLEAAPRVAASSTGARGARQLPSRPIA